MSTTVQKILYDVRALLDEYSEDGVVISPDSVADINAKGILFVDMAQKELFRTGNMFKTYKLVNKPWENKLGRFSNFDVQIFEGTDQYYPESGVEAKAYYFEVDSDFTVVIEEFEAGAWQTLQTITAVITENTSYKGNITPSTAGNLIRLRFTGNYAYHHKNRALFNVSFKTVPDYRPWVKYSMPSDFRMVDVVVQEYPERQYSRDASYKWEGFKDMYVNYFFDGEIRVIYKPVPVTITALTDTLEVDDTTANAISYYVAAKLAPFENKELVNFFEQKYNELKMESFIRMPSSEQAIVDVYGGGYGTI
jgi:hypothetical protein